MPLEALQYRQDLFAITHYHKRADVLQKITIIRAQKIEKSAV